MEQLARRAELASQHRTAYGADVVGWRESGGHLWQRERGDLLLFFPFFLSLSLSFLLFLAIFRSSEEREHQRMLPMDPPCCNVDQNRVRIRVKTSNPGWRFVHFQSPKSHNVPVCPTQVCDISIKTCSVHGGGGRMGLRWAHRAKLAPSEGPQCCLDG